MAFVLNLVNQQKLNLQFKYKQINIMIFHNINNNNHNKIKSIQTSSNLIIKIIKILKKLINHKLII